MFPKWNEYNITIIPIGGSNIGHQDPDVLAKINPNIAVILDSDLKSESSKLSPKKIELKQKFERHNIQVRFWEKNGKKVRTIENLFTKDAINEALNITLEEEVGPYDDVPLLVGRELVKRNPDFDEAQLRDDEFCRKKYNKIKHGKKIAKKMVELGHVPSDVEELLRNILSKFGLNPSSS